MPETRDTKASRKRAARERVAAMRAAQRRAARRRNLILIGACLVAVAGVVIGVIFAALPSGGGHSSPHGDEVMPPAVTGAAPVSQGPAQVAASTSGISGVTQYVTTGWPESSQNGPAGKALAHDHVPGPVTYSVVPPVGGDHNAQWMNCGVYDKPVPNERAVHNMEHGAVWITYSPSLPQDQVDALRAFVHKQSAVSPGGAAASRYLDLSPYPGLPSPVVISAWGAQLKVASPADPRLQRFVDKFRASQASTPEFGGACTGGLGTPLQS